jgi:hypothetical protein
MPATAAYQAGIEANQTRISYAMETTWSVAPTTVAFKAIRYMSDTLAETKTRQRPSEINLTREASQAVTTQQTAGGTINYALSYSTFDDFFSIVLQQDFSAFLNITNSLSDISLTVAGAVVTLGSTLATKFASIAQGRWIKLYGFTNTVNNGWWWVKTHTSDQSLILEGPNRPTAVTEAAPPVGMRIRGSTATNGVTFKSMFMQQMLSPALFLVYPGTYVTRMTLSGSVGNFWTGAIDIIAKDEDNSTTDSSTFGPVTPAPTTPVMDPVSGFVGCFWNGIPMVGTLDQLAITMENQAAAPEYGLGSQLACGILSGTFSANGTFRMYFNDFTNYNLFTNETSGVLTFIVQSNIGNSYAFTFPNAYMMVKLNAGGPGQPVFAEIVFEANPQAIGGTVIVDRLPNT